MIKHDKFIFLHLQKCAGTFVATYLEQNVPGSRWVHSNTHQGLITKPVHQFTFGVIRNPFDWYVSFYTKSTHVHGHFSKGETFPNFIKKLYQQPGMLHDMNIDYCNKHRIGVLTFRHNKTFRVYPDYICKFENLKEDLIECFKINGFPLTSEQINSLYKLEKQNTSKHKYYNEYYDDDTIKIISEREKLLIEKYGYKFTDI